MKKYTYLLTGLLLIQLAGCSVLSDSQVANVNAFSVTASQYANYPNEIFKKRAELHLENELLEIISFSDFNLLDRRIDKARATYDTANAKSAKFDLSVRLIQQYAGLLAQLSSDSYTKGMDNNATGLANNLGIIIGLYNKKVSDTLPAGLADEMSNVLLTLGRRVTRSKQAKALKKFIPPGNIVLASAVKNLVEVLDKDSIKGLDGKMYPGLKTLLADEKAESIQNYRNLVFTGRATNSYVTIRQYYDLKVDYDNTEALRQKCVATAKQLALAHDALAKNIMEKKELKEIIKETQDLFTDFQDLGKIAASWTSEIKLPTIKL